MAIFGYARVSSKDQDFNGQIDALNKAGCAKVFAEKVSGARADNRKELAKALKALAPGDTLIVTRLDRLARSTRDLTRSMLLRKQAPRSSRLPILGQIRQRHTAS
jgi:DNA invertase Pin-like site-specific DNA recombinase